MANKPDWEDVTPPGGIGVRNESNRPLIQVLSDYVLATNAQTTLLRAIVKDLWYDTRPTPPEKLIDLHRWFRVQAEEAARTAETFEKLISTRGNDDHGQSG